MSVVRITNVMSARIAGRRLVSCALMLSLIWSGACHPNPAPAAPMNYIIPPDMPDDDRVCVVIPNEPPYDPALVGVHCMTVKDLRLWFGRQKQAEH